jgi:hypothetical protein
MPATKWERRFTVAGSGRFQTDPKRSDPGRSERQFASLVRITLPACWLGTNALIGWNS